MSKKEDIANFCGVMQRIVCFQISVITVNFASHFSTLKKKKDTHPDFYTSMGKDRFSSTAYTNSVLNIVYFVF